MTRRLAISTAVFASIGLTACSSPVLVRVNLAPIHATLDPAEAAKASADTARSDGAAASSAEK